MNILLKVLRFVKKVGILQAAHWFFLRIQEDGIISTILNIKNKFTDKPQISKNVSILNQVDVKKTESKNKITLIIYSSFTPKQCFEYRVLQRLEAYEKLGQNSKALMIEDLDEILLTIVYEDIERIILFRLELDDRVSQILNLAKKLKIPTGFECDDLVFDVRAVKENLNFAYLSRGIKVSLIRHALELEKTMWQADFLIASTPALAFEMQRFQKDVFVIPNAISDKLVNLAESAKNLELLSPNGLDCNFYYGSASTANTADLRYATPGIKKALENSKNRMMLFGTKPRALRKANIRVESLSNYRFYLRTVISIPISIAPLTSSRFNECKSPIKAYEALVLGQKFLSNHALYFQHQIPNSRKIENWSDQLQLELEKAGNNDFLIKNYEIPSAIKLETVAREYLDLLPQGRL